MSGQDSIQTSGCQSVSQARQALCEQMGEAGLGASTQAAYQRALEQFAIWLGGSNPSAVGVGRAHAYVAELKRIGAKQGVYANAQAALHFFYEKVLHRQWRPTTPLRERMREDMRLHRFSVKTQKSYERSVEKLALYHGRSPELLEPEDIRRYFVHLTCERKLARATVTIAMCGIKFFYEKSLKRDWTLTGVPMPKREGKLPVVLTREEVQAILQRVEVLRHRACLGLIYACGLRLGEACRVQVSDIDRARGLLHVRNGKGAKDRYVALPVTILPLLEACWRSHRNPRWLFPWVGRGAQQGQTAERHVPIGSVQEAFRRAYRESRLQKKVSVHSLRHAYATHLLEAGVDLRQIQSWLGHNSPSVTAVYAHLTEQHTRASAQTLSELMSGIGQLT